MGARHDSSAAGLGDELEGRELFARCGEDVEAPLRFDFGEMPFRRGLRLATTSGLVRGPDKYRILDVKRRRAQIRARRELGLS